MSSTESTKEITGENIENQDIEFEEIVVEALPEGKNTKIGKGKKVAGIVALCLLGVLVIGYLAGAIFYKDRFYYNTRINGLDVSNQTLANAQIILEKETKEYVLTLEERNGVTETIAGQDIGLNIVFDQSFSDIHKEQNMFLWVVGLFKDSSFEVGSSFTYDEAALREVAGKLNVTNPTLMIEPTNAFVEFTGVDFVVNPGELGTVLIEESFYASVDEALKGLQPKLVLEEKGCYKLQTISAQSQEMVDAVTRLNNSCNAKISHKFGESIETCPKETVASWLSIGEGYTVVVNEEAVRAYIDTLAEKYNTHTRTRNFTTTSGKTIEIKKGDYGWRMNRVDTVAEVVTAVKAGGEHVLEPIWLQTANSWGTNDWGNTYVEINLSAQHLYFYKNGELIVESDLVSGNMSKNYGTPGGVYRLKYKTSPAVLRGDIQPDGSYGYESPVTYWMPFNGGIGMHDATWRGSFGGSIYKTNGSHGCINLPTSAARKIYENISSGMPIVCYY